MVTRLDHVAIGVRDLDVATQIYQQLGFEVRPGGRHTGQGTHNAIIRLAPKQHRLRARSGRPRHTAHLSTPRAGRTFDTG